MLMDKCIKYIIAVCVLVCVMCRHPLWLTFRGQRAIPSSDLSPSTMRYGEWTQVKRYG